MTSKKSKIIKIIIISLLSAIDIYLLYATIGYLILGKQAPTIVGVENTRFMGMYLMSITYFCIFAVLTTAIILLSIFFFKKKKQSIDPVQK